MADASTIAENREQQTEEACALQSIYGDDFTYNAEQHYCEVYLPSVSSVPHARLTVYLPETYPSESPPIVQVHGPHLPDDTKHQVSAALQEHFNEGEVVMFSWIEHLREQESLWEVPKEGGGSKQQPGDNSRPDGADIQAQATADASPPVSPELEAELAAMAAMSQRIVHGQPHVEKRSTFQAHVASVTSEDEVDLVMACLLQHNKIRAATHNIMAYRIVDEARGTVIKDFDDDGEDAAGGRLAHLLHASGASNVMVVVSRWFGGVLMGPVRFTAISNTARQLLEEEGYIGGGGAKDGGKKGNSGGKGKGKK